MITPPDLRPYERDAAAARDYERIVLRCYGGIWAALLAVAAGWLPPWALVAAAVLLSRAMTPFHEYYHAPLRQPPLLMRLIPVVISPLMGGLIEQRRMHFLHHRHLGDQQRDPDHPIIHGPLPIAIFYSLVQPEHALWFAVRQRQATWLTAAETAARALLFAAAVAMLGGRFLWYWVPARLLWTGNYLAFSRVLHQLSAYRDGRLPWLAERLYVPLLLGSRWLPVFRDHEVHHRLPRLRAEHLTQFRRSA